MWQGCHGLGRLEFAAIFGLVPCPRSSSARIMLTIDQLVELEIRITEEITRLKEESDATAVERETISPDVAIGRLSRLDAMQIQEIAKEGERRREERLPRLEIALEKIDTGEYGKCTRCGDWIAYERLAEQPETEHCSGCA